MNPSTKSRQRGRDKLPGTTAKNLISGVKMPKPPDLTPETTAYINIISTGERRNVPICHPQNALVGGSRR